MQEDTGKGLQCPNCKSWITYIRLKSGELVCRKCGVITTKEELESHKVG